MKKLYLLRHAQAVNPDNISDKDRKLSANGQKEAIALNEFLQKNKIVPQITLCSDAKRTIGTAKQVLQNIDTNLILQKKLYLASSGEILQHITNTQNDPSSIMVIAHNPGIQEFAYFIAKDQYKKYFSDLNIYPTCAIAEFSFYVQDWQNIMPNSGILNQFIGS